MQSADFPLLAAFLLGLLVAFNPCQLAISISALSYLLKDGMTRRAMLRQGLRYALGRMTTYVVLGLVLSWCFCAGVAHIHADDGASPHFPQRVGQYVEALLPYLLLALGLFFLVRAFFHHHHDDSCHNSRQVIRRSGRRGAFVLGLLLAFAFCPESAIFFFGMMVPLSVSAEAGWLVPPVFAVGAVLPVLLLVWLLGVTFASARRFERSMERFQMYLNAATGVVFILLAAFLLVVR